MGVNHAVLWLSNIGNWGGLFHCHGAMRTDSYAFLAAYAKGGVYDRMLCFKEFALLGDGTSRADAFDGAEWRLIAFIFDDKGFFQVRQLLSIPPTIGGCYKHYT